MKTTYLICAKPPIPANCPAELAAQVAAAKCSLCACDILYSTKNFEAGKKAGLDPHLVCQDCGIQVCREVGIVAVLPPLWNPK